MTDTIVLYDIPTRDKKSWSPNCWYARSTLNLKKIPYRTEWVEYPDIRTVVPTLGSPGDITKNEGEPPYTCPVITLPTKEGEPPKAIMDSVAIIKYIEQHYPDNGPSVRLESLYNPRLRDIQTRVSPAFRALIIPRVPDAILSERSSEYFHRTRTERFGMPLAEYERKAVEGGIWDVLKDGAKEIAELLKEDKSGPFFEGDKVGFADILVWSNLEWMRLGNKEAFDVFMESGGQELKDLWEASAVWRERNDH